MSDQNLHKLLEKDLQNALNLENLLRAERAQLESRDIGALTRTLSEKAEVLAAIERNDESRRSMLKALGLPNDSQGMRQYCAASAEGPALYDELRQRISLCAGLIEINGAIVHRSRLNTRQVLDILQGKAAQADLYTRKGNNNRTAESRAIAEA
ncbi:MAG: flagellar protein FlgN [Gammaproteobacteria bacterium]|nr:flagellar protein FlgN [Gammaproteobacteria bacterium]